MALFSFGKKKKDSGPSAKERATAERARRRKKAFSEGFVEHEKVEREYKRQRFFVQHERRIRAGIALGIAAFVLIVIAAVALIIIQNLPGRDDDRDGVLNTEDVCPGFDDTLDADDDGIPDGCEERPEFTELLELETNIIQASQDRYDVAVKVRNQNTSWGASPMEYAVRLMAADGSLITTSTRQRSFILPAQEKYLVVFNVLAVQEPTQAELVVSFVDWLKVQNYLEPRLESTTISLTAENQPGVAVSLKGSTVNRSTFTFDNVQVRIALRDGDAAGTIVALNRSEIDTLQPGESRDFIVTFPEVIPNLENLTVSYETDVDVFGNDTFVATSVVSGQRFQQFTPQTPP